MKSDELIPLLKETGNYPLSIVKHTVQFHNAKVTLDSEVGKGTIVTVKF